MRWLALVIVALALVAAGCGGSSDNSAASDETTVEETTSTDETMTDETMTDESTTDEETATTDLSGILGNEDCLALAGVGATIAQAFAGASGDTSNADELQQLVDKVPDDIKADVQTLAKAFATYSAKLQAIGIQTGSTPSAAQLQELQSAIASLDQQELTTASNHIEAWAKTNCQS
jgi:hypothetical protein